MREGSTMDTEAEIIHSLATHARYQALATKAIAELLKRADEGEAEALGLVREAMRTVDVIWYDPPGLHTTPAGQAALSEMVRRTLAKVEGSVRQ
jgi:hypothetical protein